MTTARTSTARRSFRTVAVAAIAGAGIALTPLPAFAHYVGPAAPAAAPAAAPNGAAQKAVDTALAQQGDPYRWGGNGPNAFDCSGLTRFAYQAAGVDIPRVSRDQAGFGTPVAKADLRPGDLVFFYEPVSHVAMYIGNGQIVHAPSWGSSVKVIPLDSIKQFAGARRVA